MATQYQKRMMMRKSSDLTRLAEQFKKNIEASTGEYESSFADYQKNVEAQMAPYEAASKQYKEIQMPAYETAAEAYKQRLEQYNQAIADYEANPIKRIQDQKFTGGRGQFITIEGKTYSANAFKGPADISLRKEDGQYVAYRDRPMPKKPGGAPKAPSAPQAPQVATFDEGQFEQKRGQIQQEFQREIGERKGARLAVVGRRGARPLMQDK
jgi:hypothetical protein